MKKVNALMPNNPCIMTWNIWIMILILYSMVATPAVLAFEDMEEWGYFIIIELII
jgi:hypothetical protein